MKLIEANWNPTSRQLCQFGVICAFALPLIGWLWGATSTVLGGLAGTGIVLAILGLTVPVVVKPVFVLLMLVAMPIGLVIGELAMLIIYFGVFLPIGFGFRLIGRDALQLTLDRDAETYWQPKRQPKDVASYYRQS